MARQPATFGNPSTAAVSLPAARQTSSQALRPRKPHLLYYFSKRCIDIVLAALFFVLTLPMTAIAALLIGAATRRWPLLRQTRIGQNGRPFTLLKLRTMRTATEESLPWEGGKLPDDPRVTAIGRVLRRTSIDELPQLLNVIAGQMSLVGPRPALPHEVARYEASWRRRLAVKPGLSGLWQVSGRSQVTPRHMVAMDRLYIARRSLGLDCAVMLRTVVAVLSRRGAW